MSDRCREHKARCCGKHADEAADRVSLVHNHEPDPVNMPDHYTKLPVECIDITEHFNFTLGNAIKYIWRADHKGNPIQDLEKARWYIQREIDRRKREQ